MRLRNRRAAGKSGQAMLEFALVLPLLLVIIFLCIAVSFIWGVRIAEHKAAYDAARYVAKVNNRDVAAGAITGKATDTNPTAQGAAQDVVDFDYNGSGGPGGGSWLMKLFADKPVVTEVKTGPDAGGPGNYYTLESIEVTTTYHIKGIPGWDLLNAIYGANTSNQLLTEKAVAARITNKY
jgi:Flp pilus assembly protein TadG